MDSVIIMLFVIFNLFVNEVCMEGVIIMLHVFVIYNLFVNEM